jgi:hypothetical protein
VYAQSAQIDPGRGSSSLSSSVRIFAPSRSCRLAAWTRAPSTSPLVSTSGWRFPPNKRFAPSQPRSGPPTAVPSTAWLSITAPLGSRRRPSASRTSSRSRSWACRNRPRRGAACGSGSRRCLPRRILSRQHAPGAAVPRRVEDRFGNTLHGSPRRATAPFRGSEQRLQRGPLGVGKVGGVRGRRVRNTGRPPEARAARICPRWGRSARSEEPRSAFANGSCT